jgi:hypothetical protein
MSPGFLAGTDHAVRIILLKMHNDPIRYWHDLTENYRQMSDGELLELASKPEDLTEVAQQVLRDEKRRRGLDKQPPPSAPPHSGSFTGKGYHHMVDGGFVDSYVSAGHDDPGDQADEDDTEHEYTWKTHLCDCESNDRAWQLHEALKRHGIENWVRAVVPSSTDSVGPQVYVAADELDRAQAIAALPIPQDILDEWNTAVPDFELPHCPRCGSREEVVLENTQPTNTWQCEACGAEWSDPEPTTANGPGGETSSLS